MYGMKKTELTLLPYDPVWRDDFKAEKNRITSALGIPPERIEHVGSTSIATVHAKPIIDIAILCGDIGLGPVAGALQKLGYHYRGQYDDNPGHYYAVLDRGEVRLCQAHIYTSPNEDWRKKLIFRDVLSREVELAKEYSDYKLTLAESVANKSEYAEIKTRWMDSFILKVLEKHQS